MASPSSRRAWIEISTRASRSRWDPVALLAEGVDRNLYEKLLDRELIRSPSSRRAWIEICLIASFSFLKFVALLAEGVDRNMLSLLRSV